MTEEIIVLANSKKHGGRCVAGIAPKSGRWIRPVSDLEDGKLLPHDYMIGGYHPQLLDVVEFEHGGSSHDPSQPEKR